MRKYIAIDIGGSKILGALYDEEGNQLGRKKKKTKAHLGREAVIDRLLQVIDGLWSPDVVGMGILIPGVVSDARYIAFTSNIPLSELPLSDLLEKKYKVPVRLGNDVNLALYGEWKKGEYEEKNVLGVFVGTGVGGGFLLGGELFTGRGGAAEIGHMNYQPGGNPCGCGLKGCLEAYAAKSGMLALIEKERKKGTKSPLIDHITPGEMFHTSDLYSAYQSGDPLAKKVIAQSVKALGASLGTLNNLLHPELFIFGGGIMEAFYDEICEDLHTELCKNTMTPLRENVRFVRSFLGDDAGITGAYYLAKEGRS